MYTDKLEIRATPGEHAEQLPPRYFLDKFIEDNDSDIERLGDMRDLMEDMNSVIEEQRDQIFDELGFLSEPTQDLLREFIFPEVPVDEFFMRRRNDLIDIKTVWKFTGDQVNDEVLFYLTRSHGRQPRYVGGREDAMSSILILAKGKEDGESLLELFESHVEAISHAASDFVNLGRIKKGDDFVDTYLDSKSDNDMITGWYTEETDDDFEGEVFDSVVNLTGICKRNVKVELEMTESEYDIIASPLGMTGKQYAIEVKNFDRMEEASAEGDTVDENLRYQLLTQPRREAENADLELITIVKGLEDERFDDVKQHANASNALLLDEESYEDGLAEELIHTNLRQLQQQT
jgi:hypothetical protein